MHTMKTLSEGILLLLLMFFAELSGCSDQAFYVMDDAVEYEYEQYTDYDERELEEQINGYWKYMETSEKKQEEIDRSSHYVPGDRRRRTPVCVPQWYLQDWN